MSKWKYIRKNNLRRYTSLEFLTGFLSASALVAFLNADGVPGVVFAVLAVYFWNRKRGEFSRIRKAIEDARGENL